VDTFMASAIDQARQGAEEGGIPIGSVLVKRDQIVGAGRNKRVQEDDPIIHAEIDCLRNAGRIGSYRGAVLYSTLMPCYLCAGAVVQFGIKRVVVGETSTYDNGSRAFLESHGVEVVDLNLDECKQLLSSFVEANPKLWNEDCGELEETVSE
jgi:cytosine/creatinine deaminase